jgi:signal transduction histidine kinase
MGNQSFDETNESGCEELSGADGQEEKIAFDAGELTDLLAIISNDAADQQEVAEKLLWRVFPGAQLHWSNSERQEDDNIVPSEHEVRTTSIFHLKDYRTFDFFSRKVLVLPPEGRQLDMSAGKSGLLKIMLKELEKRREKQERRTENSQTVAALIHNMRNAVTVISMWNDLNSHPEMTHNHAQLTPQKLCEDVKLSLDRLRDMSALALKMVMMGEGELKPSLKAVPVRQLIEETGRICSDHIITTNLAENDQSNVMVDMNFLNQVMDNLIVNAYKYGHYRGTPLHIDFNKVGNLLIIKVIDQGQGIKEDPEKLFKFGYRADKSKPDGYGIGLAFSRQIMESMGGHIGAQNNTEGKGSTFAIYFPLV